MEITLENIKSLDLCKSIGIISNKKSENNKYFVVNENLIITLSNCEIMTIPSGFEFDGSSTGALCPILPKVGAFFIAALIHDYMYVADYKREELGTRKAKRFADKEMLIWSNKTNDFTLFHRLDNKLRYIGVYLFGLNIYKR